MKKLTLLLALFLSACATSQPPRTTTVSDISSEAEVYLEKGYGLLSNGNIRKAIIEFDKAIAVCETEYSNSEKRVYASRGTTETLYYLVKAAAEEQDAIVIEPTCAEALYLRGYAGLDFGQLEEAEDYINKAIRMSPVNARYLSELGHIYHVKREWGKALTTFLQAEEYASAYSPEEIKGLELARAMRGVGYSLIELGRLDEAEEKFRECLKLDANDIKSKKELEYIESLRNNAQGGS